MMRFMMLSIVLLAALPTEAQKEGADLLSFAGDETIARLDKNADGKLDVEEWPSSMRNQFAALDRNSDGRINSGELRDGLAGSSKSAPRPGKVIATRLVTAADDFIVDVYHNGKLVPLTKRTMTWERFGATGESIDVEVREGDWLVFNVTNNRMRWGGVSYFGVAGINDGGAKRIGFTTELKSGRWSCCDEPGLIERFIAEPAYLTKMRAQAIENPWSEGDNAMFQAVDGWDGKPLWGASANTWIKFNTLPPD